MTSRKLINAIRTTLDGKLPAGVNIYSAASTDELALPAVVVSAELRADPAIAGNAFATVEFKLILNPDRYDLDGAETLIDETDKALASLTAASLNDAATCHVYFFRWESTDPVGIEGADMTIAFRFNARICE